MAGKILLTCYMHIFTRAFNDFFYFRQTVLYSKILAGFCTFMMDIRYTCISLPLSDFCPTK